MPNLPISNSVQSLTFYFIILGSFDNRMLYEFWNLLDDERFAFRTCALEYREQVEWPWELTRI